MSQVELEELDSLAVRSPLLGSFCCSMSEDDNISMLTSEGLLIYQFLPKLDGADSSEDTIFLSKHKVTLPEHFPTKHIALNIGQEIPRLPRLDIYDYLLKYYCNQEWETAQDVSIICQTASWSPKLGESCLIAVTTNYGSAYICAFHLRSSWIPVCNLTEKWVEQCSKTGVLTMKKRPNDGYQQFKDKLQQIYAQISTWSDLFEDEKGKFCFLIVAKGSSELSVWEIDGFDDSSFDSESHVNFTGSFSSKMHTATALKFCSHPNGSFIAVGDANGLLKIFPIRVKRGELIAEKEPTELWSEQDLMRISHIEFEAGEKAHFLIACKANYLLAFCLNGQHEVLSTKTQRFDHFNLTGCQYWGTGNFIICNQNGCIWNLKLELSSKKEILLETITYNSESNNVKGIFVSKNKAFFGVAASPYVTLHQHDMDTVILLTPENVDLVALLRENPSSSLQNYWDCLAVLRCLSYKKPPKFFSGSKSFGDIINLSMYELKLHFWLCVIMEAYILRNCENYGEYLSLPTLKQTRKLFFFKYAMERCSTILESCPNLTESQLESLQLLKDYLEGALSSGNFSNNVGVETLAEIDKIMKKCEDINFLQRKKCLYCGEDLVGAECPSKHVDLRCWASFRQITDTNYISCELCDAVYGRDAVSWPNICINCDTITFKNMS